MVTEQSHKWIRAEFTRTKSSVWQCCHSRLCSQTTSTGYGLRVESVRDHLDTADVNERFEYYSTTIDDWFETTDDVRGFGGNDSAFDMDGQSE